MEFYLQECKHNLKNANESAKIQVVLGNESCDLDSAVSSLVMAYFIYKVQKSTDIIIPVLNVKRKELPIRTEVVFFLEETSIPISDIICIDEIDLKALHKNGKLSLVLVDHNSLSDEQSYLESRIVQVMDHHVVCNPEQMKKIRNKIEPVGSCCTLIAEEILGSNTSIMDPQIAMLLYGTILLDTVGLSDAAKRVTEKDKTMVSKLELVLDGVNRKEVFDTLQRVKFDVSKLSPTQLLYKDTKYISDNSTAIALVSFPTLLQEFLQQPSFVSALREMASSKNLNSILMLGLKVSEGQCTKGAVRRQIAVYDNSPASLEKISNYLQSLENPSLGLSPVPLCDVPITLFEQKNVALTRKFVMPAMQNYLKCSHPGKTKLEESYNNGNEHLDSLNMNSNEHHHNEEVADEVITTYKTQALDFPDSPNHSKLFAVHDISLASVNMSGNVSLIPEPDELEMRTEMQYPEGTGTLKRIAVLPTSLVTESTEDDHRSLSSLSNRSDLDACCSQSDDMFLEDDAATLEDLDDNSDCDTDLDSPLSDPIPEMSAAEEFEEERSWKSCTVNGEQRKIDMKVIEPYRKVLSHGGYEGSSHNAIIIFSACYLPDRSRKDYEYVMDNLFLYVIVTLDELVAEDYVLVYLHGATERSNMPSFGWLKRCYQMIDRRLRKNLKGLYLVHPTFWLKTIVIMTRPFISSKFTRKLRFVYNLKELSSLIPLDQVCIPDKVKHFDEDQFPD